MDALIPDHVYHSMGMGDNICFGRVLGRTVDSEVTVSSGCNRDGGIEDGERTPRPMGYCNPLGM